MAETLGSLCDKLTIVKLKQYHTKDEIKIKNLHEQENQLKDEINNFIFSVINGEIPLKKLIFDSCKVYKKNGNEFKEIIEQNIGNIFANLAYINCNLWHEQEKVYEFEKIPINKKDAVVKKLAILNLERNACIDKINNIFQTLIKKTRRENVFNTQENL